MGALWHDGVVWTDELKQWLAADFPVVMYEITFIFLTIVYTAYIMNTLHTFVEDYKCILWTDELKQLLAADFPVVMK